MQKHLTPVDTVDAAMKTKSGATGTFSVSFGTTMTGSEWTVACEGGSVSISRSTVTTIMDGKEEKKGDPGREIGGSSRIQKMG